MTTTTTTTAPMRHPVSPFVPLAVTPLGWPIFPISGARGGAPVEFIVDDSDDEGDPFATGDDDEDEQDDDEQDDDTDEQDDDEDPPARRGRGQRGTPDDTDGWTPPDRQQWERVQGALKKANGEAGERRLVAKSMKKLGITPDSFSDWLLDRGIDPETGGRIVGDDGHDDADDDELTTDASPKPGRTKTQIIAEQRRAEARGSARAEARYKPGVALFAAEAEFHRAGWSGNNLSMALRLLDTDAIDVEFDEETGWPVVSGLEEQIESIKEEFPDWFRPRGDRPTAPRRGTRAGARQVDGGERRKPAPKPQGWAQQLEQRLMRGRG